MRRRAVTHTDHRYVLGLAVGDMIEPETAVVILRILDDTLENTLHVTPGRALSNALILAAVQALDDGLCSTLGDTPSVMFRRSPSNTLSMNWVTHLRWHSIARSAWQHVWPEPSDVLESVFGHTLDDETRLYAQSSYALELALDCELGVVPDVMLTLTLRDTIGAARQCTWPGFVQRHTQHSDSLSLHLQSWRSAHPAQH